jgi:hypothetical protein
MTLMSTGVSGAPENQLNSAKIYLPCTEGIQILPKILVNSGDRFFLLILASKPDLSLPLLW